MTKKIGCGNIFIGGDSPITIQSMVTKNTRDIDASVDQIKALIDAGCEIVRLAVPDNEAAVCFGKIKDKVRVFSMIPIVADIHFDYRLALASIANGADKIRINPGNIGSREQLGQVVNAAKRANIPIRVGVNSGSLQKDLLSKYGGPTYEALVESALINIRMIEEMDYNQIVVSVKSSDVKRSFEAYRLLSQQVEYPLHIGITEAGTIENGKIKSAAGIGGLLLLGIGDTIRVSLTGDPLREVDFAKKLLVDIGIRKGIQVISCPTCGRTKVDLEKIALKVEEALLNSDLSKEAITVAVMGCAVNGPGEAKEADFGVACGEGKGILFSQGEIVRTVQENDIVRELIKLIDTSKG
jgi:(E)-4-hydroxy-3-methylbut-2-enyl-diphosphate synthase